MGFLEPVGKTLSAYYMQVVYYIYSNWILSVVKQAEFEGEIKEEIDPACCLYVWWVLQRELHQPYVIVNEMECSDTSNASKKKIKCDCLVPFILKAVAPGEESKFIRMFKLRVAREESFGDALQVSGR